MLLTSGCPSPLCFSAHIVGRRSGFSGFKGNGPRRPGEAALSQTSELLIQNLLIPHPSTSTHPPTTPPHTVCRLQRKAPVKWLPASRPSFSCVADLPSGKGAALGGRLSTQTCPHGVLVSVQLRWGNLYWGSPCGFNQNQVSRFCLWMVRVRDQGPAMDVNRKRRKKSAGKLWFPVRN